MDARESFDSVLTTLSDYKKEYRSMGTPFGLVHRRLQLCARAHVPKTLYKYFNVDNLSRSVDDLRQNRLYLASPTCFDDDYDARPNYDQNAVERRLREQITPENMSSTFSFHGQFYPHALDEAQRIYEEQVNRAGGFEQYKEEQIDYTLKHLPERIDRFRSLPRCACLAEELDSDMMWGLYASKHKGFVAAYSAPAKSLACYCKHLCGGKNGCQHHRFPLSLAPVIYKGRRDITIFTDVFGGSSDLIPYITDHLYLAVLNATLYKGGRWAAEKEWRIVTLACRRAEGSTMYASMSPSALFIGSKMTLANQSLLNDLATELGVPIYKEVVTYDSADGAMQFEEIG